MYRLSAHKAAAIALNRAASAITSITRVTILHQTAVRWFPTAVVISGARSAGDRDRFTHRPVAAARRRAAALMAPICLTCRLHINLLIMRVTALPYWPFPFLFGR